MSDYFSSLRVTAASAAESAHDALLLKYEVIMFWIIVIITIIIVNQLISLKYNLRNIYQW